jgi:C-terminal processing protease CtpA/Prc
MRAYLFVWVLVLAVSVVVAAPGPPGPPPLKDRKQLRADCRRFAGQLNNVIEQIVGQYVRPVQREALLEAALVGLFQAARKPVPHDLRRQVRQAVEMSTLLQTRGSEGVAQAARPVQDPREKLLASLRERIGRPESLQGLDAVLLCCKAMMPLLDPHSGIVSAEEQRRAVGLDEESYGPGLEIRGVLAGGPLVVEAVQLGSSAQRAGLRPGDVITHIDGQAVARASPQKLLALRNVRQFPETAPVPPPPPGAAGEEPPKDVEPPRAFRIGYRRPGEKDDRQATLLRERFRAETVLGVRRQDNNTWSWWLDEKAKIAFVRLISLSRGSADDLRNVLASMKEQKAAGILLDLRWCPGGYLNEAVDVADLFLGNATIATVKSRNREDTVYRSTEQNKFCDFPVVVLVNGDTSGGAELIAAALQDHRRAVVAGQRTRGKASVQTPLPIGIDGMGIKLTTGTFHRPSGKNLHRFPDSKDSDDWGVRPDEDCRLSADLGKRLSLWWRLYSLRPAGSRERLALDDPRADPQRLAALEVLLKRLKGK